MEEIKKRCIEIAQNVGVFKKGELKILEEVLEDCFYKENYNILYENWGNKIAGFIIFGRTPLTEFSWDIYWLVVDKEYQGKGIGKRLIKRAEEVLLKEKGKAIIRIETSSQKQYTHARGLYKIMGFIEAGRIPNFYSPGDDLLIFYKEVKN